MPTPISGIVRISDALLLCRAWECYFELVLGVGCLKGFGFVHLSLGDDVLNGDENGRHSTASGGKDPQNSQASGNLLALVFHIHRLICNSLSLLKGDLA